MRVDRSLGARRWLTEGRSAVDLFEYQARDLFEVHGVPVLAGIVAENLSLIHI